MSKKSFQNVSPETVDLIRKASENVSKQSLQSQREQIKKDSPYSAAVNNRLSGYDEFYHLYSIGLVEANVTRPSLIRDIDPNLYITSKQKTNYELMTSGAPPYLADDETQKVMLHHIGQEFDAPFAELTVQEHSLFGNSKLLHNTKQESWRNDPEKEKQFEAEKYTYWKKRALGEFEYVKTRAKKATVTIKQKQKDVIQTIKEPLETLFSECSTSDLKYISNLANSYIFLRQIGAVTIEDFVLNLQEEFADSVKCPKCGSSESALFGFQSSNNERRQRYKCKSCGTTFTLFHNAIISGCTMTLAEWLQFIDCLYNGFSLEKTADLCNMSVTAAFNNRMRLFYALKLMDEQVYLEGNVVIDETYVLASHKGNRSKQQDELTLTRAPHKRGHENSKKGLSKEQTCIVCALDDKGNSVARIAGLGAPSAKKLEFALNGSIKKEHVEKLFSDQSITIKRFADNNGLPIHQTTFAPKRRKYNPNKKEIYQRIQTINAYHSRLKKFLLNFNGVSTDLLSGYLYLFSWKDRSRNMETIDAYKELLSIMVKPNLYKSVDEITVGKLIPSAFDFEKSFKKETVAFRDLEEAKQIYARHANGETFQEIGDSLGRSRQAVHQIVAKFRKAGLAYKTEREKQKETKITKMERFQDALAANNKENWAFWYSLYLAQEEWTGPKEDFFQEMASRYNLSAHSIENRISDAKRVLQLRETFYIHEKYEHKTLEEIYEWIYSRYNELASSIPDISDNQRIEILGEEFGYGTQNIYRIISSMKEQPTNRSAKKKMRAPKGQTLNRDISVFIDFIKWPGSRASFYEFAKEKYGLTLRTVQKILQYHYMADPTRYELAK